MMEERRRAWQGFLGPLLLGARRGSHLLGSRRGSAELSRTSSGLAMLVKASWVLVGAREDPLKVVGG